MSTSRRFALPNNVAHTVCALILKLIKSFHFASFADAHQHHVDLLDRNRKFVEESNTILEQRNDSFKATTAQSQARVLELEQEKSARMEELTAATNRLATVQVGVTVLTDRRERVRSRESDHYYWFNCRHFISVMNHAFIIGFLLFTEAVRALSTQCLICIWFSLNRNFVESSFSIEREREPERERERERESETG